MKRTLCLLLLPTNCRLVTGSLLGGGVARTIIKSGDGDLAITGGATDLLAGSQLNASGAGVLELMFPALGAGASFTQTVAQHPLGAATFQLGGGLRLLADGDGTTVPQTFVLDHDLAMSGNFLLETDRRSVGTNKVFQLGDLSLADDTVLSVSTFNGYKTTAADVILAGDATIQGTTSRTTVLSVNALTGGAGTLTLGGPATHTLNIAAAATRSGPAIVTGGVVNANAGGAFGSGTLAINAGTVKAGANGAVREDDPAWVSGKETKNEDVSSDVSTPLFYQGRFYVLNSDRKSMSCVQPKTGRLVWEHRVEGGAEIESSPTAGDGKIYFQDMRANVTIMAVGDKAEVLFSGSMADGEEKDVRSSIALANGCAFVRTTRMLYCVGGK